MCHWASHFSSWVGFWSENGGDSTLALHYGEEEPQIATPASAVVVGAEVICVSPFKKWPLHVMDVLVHLCTYLSPITQTLIG